MKIRPVGAELFKAEGRTDRYGEANSRFPQFCERAWKPPPLHFKTAASSLDETAIVRCMLTHLGNFKKRPLHTFSQRLFLFYQSDFVVASSPSVREALCQPVLELMRFVRYHAIWPAALAERTFRSLSTYMKSLLSLCFADRITKV